jgi:hypothetical protein
MLRHTRGCYVTGLAFPRRPHDSYPRVVGVEQHLERRTEVGLEDESDKGREREQLMVRVLLKTTGRVNRPRDSLNHKVNFACDAP